MIQVANVPWARQKWFAERYSESAVSKLLLRHVRGKRDRETLNFVVYGMQKVLRVDLQSLESLADGSTLRGLQSGSPTRGMWQKAT